MDGGLLTPISEDCPLMDHLMGEVRSDMEDISPQLLEVSNSFAPEFLSITFEFQVTLV